MRYMIAAVAMAFTLTALGQDGYARKWKPGPVQRAQEYLLIDDSRRENGTVMVMWLAPSFFEERADPQIKEIFGNRIVIGALDVEVSPAGLFQDVSTGEITVKSGDGQTLPRLDSADFDPMATGALTLIQQVFTANLGPLGQTIRWYYFDPNGLDGCTENKLLIEFSGETYHYDTPLPNC